MEALREIDLAILGTTDFSLALNTILEKVMSHLKVDAASIMLLNCYSNMLEFIAGRGFRSKEVGKKTQIRLGQGYAGRVALEQKTIFIPDVVNVEPPF